MRSIFSLCKVYFLELLREKLLVVGLVVAICLSLLGMTLGSLSFDEKQRIFFHLSISAMHMISLVLALIYGSTTMNREVERQTCLLILARPVTRAQFYLAKFFSISLIVLLFQALVWLVILLMLDNNFELSSYLKICTGIFLEIETVLASCFLIAVFVRPSLAIFWGCGIFLLGNWLPELNYFASKSDSEIYKMVNVVASWIIPNLYSLNWRSYQQLVNPISNTVFVTGVGHALAWIGLYLVGGITAWKRRDIV